MIFIQERASPYRESLSNIVFNLQPQCPTVLGKEPHHGYAFIPVRYITQRSAKAIACMSDRTVFSKVKIEFVILSL